MAIPVGGGEVFAPIWSGHSDILDTDQRGNREPGSLGLQGGVRLKKIA